MKINNEETKEQLQEELIKVREELELQKWGAEKTVGSLEFLLKENIQNKINEIEKINKLMIDRELKMIKLKKELSIEKSKNLQNQKAIDK